MSASLLWCSGPLTAQSPTTGAIRGTVRDSTGEALSGVLLTVREAETSLPRAQFNERTGEYRFGLLPEGTYEIAVEKLGYEPRRITGIRVVAGVEVEVNPVLAALSRTAPTAAAVTAWAGSMARRPGASESLTPWSLRMLPHARRTLGEVARLSSRADARLGLDGLPAWFTSVIIDGVQFRPARVAVPTAMSWSTSAFALGGLASGQLMTSAADVEYGGAAGGWLSANARRGTVERSGEALAAWSGSPLPSSIEDAPTHHDVQGALFVRLPVGDSARLSAGVDVERLETPVGAAWSGSETAATLAELGESYGVDFAASTRPSVARTEAIRGHVRLDWNMARRHRFAGWGYAAMLPQLAGRDVRSGLLQSFEGTDAVAGLALTSTMGARTHNDLRLSLTFSARDMAGSSEAGPAWIISDDLAIGGPRANGRGEEMRVTVTDALHLIRGRHTLKLGGGLAVVNRDYQQSSGPDGEVFFGSLEDVLARRGLTIRTDAPAAGAEWQTVSPLLFIQDRMQISEGLSLTAGIRAERAALPVDGVARDEEWERLSGLLNDSVDAVPWRTDVRAALTWDVQRNGRWLAYADAGMYQDEIDPGVLALWQMDGGGTRVRREFGQVRWPDDAAPGGALRRVTLLGPGFAAPLTTRGVAGVSVAVSPATTVQLSATVRRTENLPRRTDLNLQPLPGLRDQYGRGVYGTLFQSSALLAAEPGTGRRFADYDEVSGVNADGWSDYHGITVGVDHALGGGGAVLGRYTFSRTRDNWFAGRQGGWTVPAPTGLAGDEEWAEGRSDFDAPHRIVAAATVPLPLNASLAAVYRGESGAPFTPGFRRGVDANADGFTGNDPAFVDAAATGMSEVIGRWSCLRESGGEFAARNSCRAPAVHALDLSLKTEFLRREGMRAALAVEVFDLLESAAGPVDSALFLIDPNGALTVDEAGRTVTMPLAVNPDFGNEQARPYAGRTIRLSMTVNW